MEQMVVGIAGLGTVGSQVFLQLKEIEAVTVKTIFVRDLAKKRNLDIGEAALTDSLEELIQDEEIQVILECLGGNGADLAYRLVMEGIERGKHLILSSKKNLALHMGEILHAALEHRVWIGMEATTAGAVPVCRELHQMRSRQNIQRIYGIVNATTNYILCSMEENLSYEEALELARRNGYAEADPGEDVEGVDALYKMRILAWIAMGADLDPLKLQAEGFPKQPRKGTRQIFYLEKTEEDTFRYYIGPWHAEQHPMLSGVQDSFNMVFAYGEKSGLRGFYGRGAGGTETASVMIEDLDILIQGDGRLPVAKQEEAIRLTSFEVQC